MEWKKPYFEALIETLHPFGDVLEIGFGASSLLIQKYHPRIHTIIESDPAIQIKARAWAKKHPTVQLIEDTWQNALPRLGVFDAIFLGEQQSHENKISILREGNLLVKEIQNQIPQITRMRYSDSELDAFCKSTAKSAPKELSRFLSELEQNGQITKEQLKEVRKKYHLKIEKPSKSFIRCEDESFQFFQSCALSHMRVGSRFSCFLADSTSKYEDPQFFEKIIANPYFSFQETAIPLKIPKTCTDFKGKKALIIFIEKLG
ncbi:MAG: hypothetical protein V4487_06725 [Chlamydiota bacterium]